jgi:hypothetical protein
MPVDTLLVSQIPSCQSGCGCSHFKGSLLTDIDACDIPYSFKLGGGLNFTPASPPGSSTPAAMNLNGHMSVGQPTPYFSHQQQQMSPNRGRPTDGQGFRSRKGSSSLFADPASSIRRSGRVAPAPAAEPVNLPLASQGLACRPDGAHPALMGART